ncbi:MAG: DUF1826 domain-containing protein [Roseibium sp.]|nr:DUF1826 domain-containing protein [Roseibium sp.]
MNVVQKPHAFGALKAQDVLGGKEPDILADITRPGVAAAIWQRTPEPEFQDWLDNQPAENLPSLRAVTPLDAVEEVLLASCEQANMPFAKMRNMLVEDAAALACMAGKALGTRLCGYALTSQAR